MATMASMSVNGVSYQETRVQASTRDLTVLYFNLPSITTLGVQTASIYYTSHGVDRAGLYDITIMPEPDARIISYFPAAGLSDGSYSIQTSVNYLPLSLTTARVSAWFKPPASAQYLIQLAVTSIIYTSRQDCEYRSCSSATLVIRTPDINPEGVLGAGSWSIIVCAEPTQTACSPTPVSFHYIPANAPIVELVQPARGSAVANAATTVQVSIRNLPSISSFSEVVLKLAWGTATVTGAKQVPNTNLLIVTATIGASGQAGLATSAAYRQADGGTPLMHASFDFLFVRPPPEISPIDGTLAGGSVISVKLYWNDPGTLQQMTARFASSTATVLAITSKDSSSVTLSVRTPSATAAGMASVTVTGKDGISDTFQFEYYHPPTVTDVQPRSASLDGRAVCTTSFCALGVSAVGQGKTVSLKLSNFPFVDSAEELQVQFRSMVDSSLSKTCDGTVCSVRNIQNLVEDMYLTLTLPTWPSADVVEIIVTFTGRAQAPVGGGMGIFVREQKSCSSVSLFSFKMPVPVVLGTLWCLTCHPGPTCVVMSLCGDGSTPLSGRGSVLGLIPQSVQGRLTVLIDDLPQVSIDAQGLPVSGSLQAIIGGNAAALFRVVFSTSARTVLEVVPDVKSVAPAVTTASVEFTPSLIAYTARYSVMVYNDAIETLCIRDSCKGSSAGGNLNVEVSVTNFPITDPAQDVTVMFGSVIATNVRVDSRSGQVILRISAPAYDCSACSYKNGLAQVELSITSKADSNVRARTTYSFYRAPRVTSVRFSTPGNTIEMTFDSDTNTPASSAASCQGVVDPELAILQDILGTSPSCFWISARILVMLLGQTASVLPGSACPALKADAIRSFNNLSPAVLPSSTSAVQVLAPLILVSPSPISIKGPSQIDPCSDLALVVSLSSPRAASYTWGCSNHGGFDGYLKTQIDNSIVLPEGTSVMSEYQEYKITVFATDFLGAQSKTLELVLAKVSSAAPEISFVGLPSYTRGQLLLIRGEAQFSKCPVPKTNIKFVWTQESILPTTAVHIPTNTFVASPQLAIARNTLSADSTYLVKLRVEMGGDPSKTSSKSFQINVVSSPLQLYISGSSNRKESENNDFVLSAVLVDPDAVSAEAAMVGVTFSWACSYLVGGLPYECRHRTTNSVLEFGRTSSITVPKLSLAASDTLLYSITVIASKGKRQASNGAKVSVVSGPIPKVDIQSHSFSRRNSDGVAKVNRFDRLIFSGISSSSALSWSISPAEMLADSATLARVAPFGMKSSSFILDASQAGQGGFSAGQQYTVKLMAIEGSQVGQAEMIFVVNRPPTSGQCVACVGSLNSCSKNGRALLDTVRMSCTKWADEDQPLRYRIGTRTSSGEEMWFDTTLDSFMDLQLQSGSISMTAQIIDSLGAASDIQSDTVIISPATFRRRLLATDTSTLDLVLLEIKESNMQGRSDEVNSKSLATCTEMQGKCTDDATCSSYKTDMVGEVAAGTTKVVLTAGYALETAQAAGACTQDPCQIATSLVMTSTNIANAIVQLTTEEAFDASLAQHLTNILSTITSASRASKVCPGQAPLTNLSYTLEKSVQDLTIDTTHRLGAQILALKLSGEIPESYTGSSGCYVVSAEKNFLAAIRDKHLGVAQQGAGANAPFHLPPDIASQLGKAATSTLQVVSSRRCTGDNTAANLKMDYLSQFSNALTLFEVADNTAVPVSGLTTPISVCVDLDATLYAGRAAWWTQKASCGFYDAGRMSFRGCVPVKVHDVAGGKQVCCNCTHLTDFAGGIDPSMDACGDGQISGSEQCDDDNSASNDGCSASTCKIESAWACWSVPSICCGPCPKGQVRVECGVTLTNQPRTIGSCQPCHPGLFKNSSGGWDSVCTPCSAGTYALGGNDLCVPFQVCGAGTELSGMSKTSAGIYVYIY